MNSEMRASTLLSLFSICACAMIIFETVAAHAKVWSIDERQLKLMQDINQGQKLKQLTPKEAKKLREALSDIARKKKKFQNGDGEAKTFSDAQKSELESDLNKVSTDVKKIELEKRVQK
jgi:Skp family chaperone for outer membrane proteins